MLWIWLSDPKLLLSLYIKVGNLCLLMVAIAIVSVFIRIFIWILNTELCNRVMLCNTWAGVGQCSWGFRFTRDIVLFIYLPKYFILQCAKWLYLTQLRYMCIASVFTLTAECSALTVNLVVTLRKFLSLLLSVIYFNNSFTFFHWAGTLLVFAGTLLFSDLVYNCVVGDRVSRVVHKNHETKTKIS